jgi:hypothetical protein
MAITLELAKRPPQILRLRKATPVLFIIQLFKIQNATRSQAPAVPWRSFQLTSFEISMKALPVIEHI